MTNIQPHFGYSRAVLIFAKELEVLGELIEHDSYISG